VAVLARVTEAIRGNEPCMELAEINRVIPVAGAGLHRFQIVRVVRDDEVWEWTRDMGKASNYKTEQFIFPGHVPLGNGHFEVLETVERLQAAANEYRARFNKPTPRKEAPINFKALYEEYATRRRDSRKGRVRFAMNERNA
jgi:hypothetical protein